MGLGPSWFDLAGATREMKDKGPTGEALFDERARPAFRQLDRLRPPALAKALMSNPNPAPAISSARLWWWRAGTLAERWRD